MNRGLKQKISTSVGKIVVVTESGESTIIKLDEYFSESELVAIKNVVSYTIILNKANFLDKSLHDAIRLWFQSTLLGSLSERSRQGKLFGDLLKTCLFFREEGALLRPEEEKIEVE